MIETEFVKALIHAVSTDIFHVLIIPVAVFSIFFYFFGVVGIMQKESRYTGKKTGKLPKITIQIPTFNEPVAIRCAEQCLMKKCEKHCLILI